MVSDFSKLPLMKAYLIPFEIIFAAATIKYIGCLFGLKYLKRGVWNFGFQFVALIT